MRNKNAKSIKRKLLAVSIHKRTLQSSKVSFGIRTLALEWVYSSFMWYPYYTFAMGASWRVEFQNYRMLNEDELAFYLLQAAAGSIICGNETHRFSFTQWNVRQFVNRFHEVKTAGNLLLLFVTMSPISKLVSLIILLHWDSFCLAGNYLSDVPQCTTMITSEYQKNGTVTSLHHPHPYPPKTHCRYDFVGNSNERVRLVFKDLNLYHPDRNYSDCGGGDVVSVFVYKDGQLARVEDYCGIVTPPIAVMSPNNKLTLELHAPHSSRVNRGFSALYSFVTDYGIETGRQDIRDGEYPCTFIYNSSVGRNGTFQSPNHSGLYPRDTTCNYLFYGKKGERVDVDFTYFHIDGIQPCDAFSHSDYVEFSNYLNVDRKYDRQCGTLKDYKINSDNNFFRVTFKSNDRYDATGFQATYQFSDKTQYLKPKNYKVSSTATSINYDGGRYMKHHKSMLTMLAALVSLSFSYASAILFNTLSV